MSIFQNHRLAIMKRSSFTLIELLITIVVSALVINGVVISVINSMVLSEYNRTFSIAVNIARSKMETILSNKTNFDAIVSVVSSDQTTQLTEGIDGIKGRFRIDVTDVVSGEVKNIQVAVCWQVRNRIIGDCELSAGTIVWKSVANPTSPCVLKTAVTKR